MLHCAISCFSTALGSSNAVKWILLSDEKRLILTTAHSRGYWVDPKKSRRVVEKQHNAASVWIWLDISWQGFIGPLFPRWGKAEKFNAVHYQTQVLGQSKEKLKEQLGPRARLMEDGAPPHRAKRNAIYRALNGIRSFPPAPHRWPPNTPNRNPTENAWADLDRYLHSLPSYPNTRTQDDASRIFSPRILT